MKYLLLLITLMIYVQCSAQKISGVIVDKTTKQPVSGVLVSSRLSKTHTDLSGRFELEVSSVNDTLKTTHFAYKTCIKALSKVITTLYVELEPSPINLKEVQIRSNRDFKKDSLANREEFAQQFNYKAPRVADAFLGKPNKDPGELITLNPLALLAALTKKSSPDYQFNQMLVRDEHEAYVNHKFNRGIASRITGLKGDTLAEFLIRYRPDYKFALKATDYDMEVYVKDCFKKFKKEGLAGTNPFVDPANKNKEPVKLSEF